MDVVNLSLAMDVVNLSLANHTTASLDNTIWYLADGLANSLKQFPSSTEDQCTARLTADDV